MKKKSNVVCGLLLILTVPWLAACGGISVRHESSPEVDFAGLRTYSWRPDPKMLSLHPLDRTEERHHRLMAVIEEELGAKGYEKTESGQGDFVVGYAAHTITQFSTKHRLDVPVGARTSPSYGWSPLVIHLNTYDEDSEAGILVVAMRTPDSEPWQWKGFAEGVIQESLSENARRERVDGALRDILKGFPARK